MARGGVLVSRNGYLWHPALQGIVGYVLHWSDCPDDILQLCGKRMGLQEEALLRRSANV